MLNDDSIKRLAEENSFISPFSMDCLQPHSYDCTLGEHIKTPKYAYDDSVIGYDAADNEAGVISWEDRMVCLWVDGKTPYRLFPLQFALGGTNEYFKVPQDIVGFVQGKSTVGRNGLQIECAGLIDAGFEGNITLELFNMAPWPIDLKFSQRICQVHFTYVDSPLHKDYSKIGHYNKQTGATAPVYTL